MSIQFFKKIIILFWTLWWLIALWTDIAEGFAHLELLKASWVPDANYPFLKESLSIYPLPAWVTPFLYICIIFGSLTSSILFIWAAFSLNEDKTIWMKRADKAFIFSLTFWMAFFLADQCVFKFDLEENHMVQGGFELLTYLALYILP